MITKFEVYVQDVLQELEEAAENNGEIVDDEELEAVARRIAKQRFDEYFGEQLEGLSHPPRAIVPLSRSK